MLFKKIYIYRQQNIINIVAKWPPSQGMITIEDICEKPINRLNIARAFSDLLSKYLVLFEDNISCFKRSLTIIHFTYIATNIY